MRISPEPEKAQVLDLRAKLQAAREAKKDKDSQVGPDQSDLGKGNTEGDSQSHLAERRITRALARHLHIEQEEDEEDWEGSASAVVN